MKTPSFTKSFLKIAVVFVLSLSPALLAAQDASPDGSLVWSYPIKAPAGLRGMGPSLSINYNSSGGNSFLGMGMQLGGLSAITRDQSYGITFGASDHFLLDGQKLVKTANWVYHPERETYQKIEASSDPNNSSSYWTVTAKNGTKYYYGYTNLSDGGTTSNDGRITAVGSTGSPTLVWLLSRVEDVFGNYYVIEYAENPLYIENTINPIDGDYYPVKITYTKNSIVGGISKYNTIEFSYETRTDANVQYLPTRFKMDKILKWVTVKTGGNLVRKYRFDYTTGASTQRSRLNTIQEYGTDGTSTLPATTLEWSNGIDNFEDVNEQNLQDPISTLNYSTGFADFNGDGKADIWKIEVNSAGSTPFYVRIATQSGFATAQSWGTGFGSTGNYQLGTADFNGDGKADVWEITKSSAGQARFYVWLSTGTGFTGDGNTNYWGSGFGSAYYYQIGKMMSGRSLMAAAVPNPSMFGYRTRPVQDSLVMEILIIGVVVSAVPVNISWVLRILMATEKPMSGK
jgi:hypothetical protein